MIAKLRNCLLLVALAASPAVAQVGYVLPGGGSTSTYLRGDNTWGTPTSGAPTDASYITKTADATLSAEFAMGSLGTGLVKNTTTTGTPSIAVAGTDYVAPGGALGTPASGTVTNLTGTASININGTVGATTPSTGAFTSFSASSGTLTGSAPFTFDQTWNNAGVTFTGLRVNAVNSASSSSSLIVDFQLGGVTQLNLRRDGLLSTGAISCGGNFTGSGAVQAGANIVGASDSSGLYLGASNDTILVRDAADTWANRRGANAQTFRSYRTYTDASNYERLALQSGSGYFEVASQSAGTGTANIDLRLTPKGTGKVVVAPASAGSQAGCIQGSDNSTYGIGINSGNFWFGNWLHLIGSQNTARLNSNMTLGWSTDIFNSANGLILGREADAILQMGLDVNGSAVHQTLKAHDGITGTNIAGANLTLAGGRSTGSAAGGAVIFQAAPAGSSGTTASVLEEVGRFDVASGLQLTKTVTAGGMTGAQTINKQTGSVNFAASATSLVVTNSKVTTSSVIIATVGTNDTTMKDVQAVAGSGSFTLYPNAAPTAETRVNFLITN